MKARRDRPLSDAVLEAMLMEIEPVPPPKAMGARIRRRVRDRVNEGPRPTEAGTIDIRRAAGWRPLGTASGGKAEMKVLHDDGQTMTWLVRMSAGCTLEGHEHDGTEECLVLEGDFWLNDVRYGPGDYQIAFAGSRHHSARTEGGCLVFVRSPSPRPTSGTAD